MLAVPPVSVTTYAVCCLSSAASLQGLAPVWQWLVAARGPQSIKEKDCSVSDWNSCVLSPDHFVALLGASFLGDGPGMAPSCVGLFKPLLFH